MIAERTRDKVVAARRKGKWTGGPVPIGYRIVDGKLAIDEAEARIVRQMFGLYEAHHSIVRIIDELNGVGDTTKNKHLWRKDGVIRVLRNPIYAGFTRHERERFPGEHAPIIDVAMFDRVQAMMSRPAPILNRRGVGDSLLRGIARCGDCKAAMVVEHAHRGKRVYRYLRCDTAQKRGSEACKVRTRLPHDPVEAVVVGVLREAARAPDFSKEVREALQGRIDHRRHDLGEELALLPTAIGEASSHARRVSLALVEAPDSAKPVVKRQLEEACAILEAKEARLAELRREMRGLAGLEADADWVERTLGRFDELWTVLTDANRVVLVQAVVDEVVLDADREEVRVALTGAKPNAARTPVAEGS